MSWGTYLGGLAILLVELLALLVTGVAVRRRWLGDWRGAPARLAEATAALGVLYTVGLGLGAVGAFRRGPAVIVVVLVGLGSSMWLARRRFVARGVVAAERSHSDPDAFAADRPRWRVDADSAARAAAIVAVLFTSAVWSIHTAASYRRGIYDGDSMWYHGPFAARFVQTGWVTRILYVNSEPLVPFFPANSEIVHAWFALPFHRDVLSPALNLAWLALLFLAGWCVGRPWRRGPVGLAATAVIAGTPVMSATQAGTARNDIVGLALLVTAIALLVQPGRRPAAMALGGVACGLALGVKTSLLIPAILIALVGVVVGLLPARTDDRPTDSGVVAARSRRVNTRGVALGCWAIPVVAFGAYWYVRNWVRVGNPLPWLSFHAGPIRLESPPLPQAAVGKSALTNRLGDSGWWAQMVRPGLRTALGPLWPLLFVVALSGVAVGVVAVVVMVRDGYLRTRGGVGTSSAGLPSAVTRSGRWLPPLLSFAALAAAAAYLATPNSAPLRPGGALARYMFLLNFRYALPAVVVALLVLAVGRLGDRWLPTASVLALGVLAVVAPFPGTLRQGWEFSVTGRDVAVGLVALGAAVAGVLVIVVVTVAIRRGRQRGAGHPRRSVLNRSATPWALAGVLIVGGAFVGGRSLANRYLDHRYAGAPPYPEAVLWRFGRQVHDARVGVVGDFFQYAYVGPKLSNQVGYVGVAGKHGAFRDARTCREWYTALREDRVGYVVISQGVFTGLAARLPQLVWTRQIPGAVPVRSSPGGGVFHLTQEVDSADCH